MTPSPSPSPDTTAVISAGLNAITSVATAISHVVSIPSIPTSVLYIVAILGGLVGMYYLRNFISGWANEVKTPGDDTSAADGKAQTSTSATNVQDQTNQLPKD